MNECHRAWMSLRVSVRVRAQEGFPVAIAFVIQRANRIALWIAVQPATRFTAEGKGSGRAVKGAACATGAIDVKVRSAPGFRLLLA